MMTLQAWRRRASASIAGSAGRSATLLPASATSFWSPASLPLFCPGIADLRARVDRDATVLGDALVHDLPAHAHHELMQPGLGLGGLALGDNQQDLVVHEAHYFPLWMEALVGCHRYGFHDVGGPGLDRGVEGRRDAGYLEAAPSEAGVGDGLTIPLAVVVVPGDIVDPLLDLRVGSEQWAPELLLDPRLSVVASRHGVHAGSEPREAQAVECTEYQSFGQFPLGLGDRLKSFAEHVGRDPLVDVPAGLQVRP